MQPYEMCALLSSCFSAQKSQPAITWKHAMVLNNALYRVFQPLLHRELAACPQRLMLIE